MTVDFAAMHHDWIGAFITTVIPLALGGMTLALLWLDGSRQRSD